MATPDATPPVDFPDYTFLHSDHTTTQLACDVAEEMSRLNATVFVDDFLAPIHDGWSAMSSTDWKRDWGLPSSRTGLVLEALTESTENDIIVSLEKWFIDQFGELRLGHLARRRTDEVREVSNYAFVFRDATQKHTVAFSDIPMTRQCHIKLTPEMTVQSVLALIGRTGCDD